MALAEKASRRAAAAVALLRARYEYLVVHNAEQVLSAESAIRSATYLLPGRFAAADVLSENVFACANLLRMYHDSLLAQVPTEGSNSGGASSSAGPAANAVPDSHAGRYRRWMSLHRPLFHTLSLALAAIRTLECSAEMGASFLGGGRLQLRTIAMIEALKLACRLALFAVSGARMVLTGSSSVSEGTYDVHAVQAHTDAHPLPYPTMESVLESARANRLKNSKTSKNKNQVAPAAEGSNGSFEDVTAAEILGASASVIDSQLRTSSTWTGKRSGRQYLNVSRITTTTTNNMNEQENETENDQLENALYGKMGLLGSDRPDSSMQYLVSRALVDPSTITALDLLPSLKSSPRRRIGEYIYMMRPLVYVLLVMRYGKRSWTPWVVSLLMELGSLSAVCDRTRPSVARVRAQERLANAGSPPSSPFALGYEINEPSNQNKNKKKHNQSAISLASSAATSAMSHILKGITTATESIRIPAVLRQIGQLDAVAGLEEGGEPGNNVLDDPDMHIPKTLTPLEWEEYKFRMKILLLYLLRSPFYEMFIERKLSSFIESGRKRMLISLFVNIIADYKPLWESWYYYKNGY